MRVPSVSKLILVLCILTTANYAAAGLIAAPGTPTKDNLSTIPKWLTEGKGDDGYVTITAQIVMPDVSCTNLGRAGWLGIGKESIQIVASVRTSGFPNALNDRVVPLATFDSRTNPGECRGLNTFPLTIVPLARLEPYSGSTPGKLSMLFDVKSTSNSDVNLVATAQVALGTAAVFATGGAAATVVGLSSKLSEPALLLLEGKVNEARSNALSGEAPLSLTWAQLREGVGSVTVPVYGGKASRGKEARAIEDLKKSTDARAKLFDIVLTFTYQRSLFETLSNKDDVPKGENVTRSRVLSYPNWDQKSDGVTLLQMLNGSSFSLLQEVSGTQSAKDWTDVCAKTLTKLRDAGLNQLDRAIVLKAFLDEAKDGGDWYSSPNVNACLNNLAAVKSDMLRVYGSLTPFFETKDTMDGSGEAFLKWKYTLMPTLARFQQALTSREGKLDSLAALSAADLKVEFYPSSAVWLAGAEPAPSSGLARLGAKAIKRAGCFVYGDDLELDNVAGYGGHMVLLGDNDDQWHAKLRAAPNDPLKISYIHLSPLDDSWRAHFKSQHYNGGDCPGIIKNL